ncbi:MAG: hypothetical protein LBR70_01015 [Lactobacillaceae bacterium]|jgi:hypothetical protein|nr:hypothetical protein [Lactobacillaceae bacterium]
MTALLMTPRRAKELFIAEFGSLARLFNPSSLAYDGYKFAKKLILIAGKTMVAQVAWNTDKENLAIVSYDGEYVDMVDYDAVKIYDCSELGAKELFQFFFPTLWAIFNPADVCYACAGFNETEGGFSAVDFTGQHRFVVPNSGEPYITDPA